MVMLTWNETRLISAGLVPLTIAPFAGGSLNPVLDAVLCSLLIVHSHIGFQYAETLPMFIIDRG